MPPGRRPGPDGHHRREVEDRRRGRVETIGQPARGRGVTDVAAEGLDIELPQRLLAVAGATGVAGVAAGCAVVAVPAVVAMVAVDQSPDLVAAAAQLGAQVAPEVPGGPGDDCEPSHLSQRRRAVAVLVNF